VRLHSIELAPLRPGLSRTLVLLHGYGADESDLLPIAHELDPRLRAVSLQAPLSLGGPMRAWFQMRRDARGISFDAEEARGGLRAVTEAVEEIARASPRPFLLGFSQGAAMALGVLLTRPDLPAGVIALSAMPPGLEPQELAPAEKLKGLPVFAGHGTDDPLLPIELARTVRDELQRLGLDLSWHEYPMGHMVIPEEISDVAEWLQPRL
jgi:phospholipase/carboxylesterase